MKKVCLWCNKEINKYKDSICESCGEKVLKGTYDLSAVLNNYKKEREANNGNKGI